MQKNQQRLIYLICSLLPAWQLALPATAQITREQRMQLSDIVNKGNYLMSKGQYQAAIDEYSQCFMIDPGNQVAKDNTVLCHNNWGISLFRQHKYDEAQSQWDEALKLNPYDRNAKNNLRVLKVTLDRQGAQTAGEKNEEGGKAKAPKKAAAKPAATETTEAAAASDQAPSGAVILSPGVKQSAPGETAGAQAEAPSSASSSDEFSGTSIKILPSTSAAAASPAPPSPPPTPTPKPTPTPTPTPPIVSPITNIGASTIEDQLAGVEMKVYGRKQENLPVFQRLEKLELDTSGSVKQGTVQDRIQVLRHSYGL